MNGIISNDGTIKLLSYLMGEEKDPINWAKISLNGDTCIISNRDSSFYFIGQSTTPISMGPDSESKISMLINFNSHLTSKFGALYTAEKYNPKAKYVLICSLLDPSDFFGYTLGYSDEYIFENTNPIPEKTDFFIFFDTLSNHKINPQFNSTTYQKLMLNLQSKSPIVIRQSIQSTTFSGNKFKDGGLTRSQIGDAYDYGNYTTTETSEEIELYQYNSIKNKLESFNIGYIKGENDPNYRIYDFKTKSYILEIEGESEYIELLSKIQFFIKQTFDQQNSHPYYSRRGNGNYIRILF